MKKFLIISLVLILLLSMIACEKEPEECLICDGDGVRRCYMIERYKDANGLPTRQHDPKTCTVCDDSGNMVCNACRGKGWRKD